MKLVKETEEIIKAVTVTMTAQEAGILLAILNKVGGTPDKQGLPLPRGLIDGWHELGHEVSGFHPGLRRMLSDAGIMVPEGLIVTQFGQGIYVNSHDGFTWG